MSTQQQRQEWRELAEALVPGEWNVRPDTHLVVRGPWIVVSVSLSDAAETQATAAFIAAAREAVPQLLADVDALQAERDALAAELAERTTVTEQISMALHVRDTQLTAAIAERDALAAELERVRAQLDAVPEPMLHKASTRPLWTDDTPTPGTR